MNITTPVKTHVPPVHKAIPTPRKRDLLILRFLIIIGIMLLMQFLYWYFNEAHIGHPILFWILTVAFGYKMLQTVYEWYYYASISLPKRPDSSHTWTVDMLTTYVPGEPYDMIVETLTAMVNVCYPHTTYLCDEGNDPFLKQICAKLGVVHVYRGKDKTGAKAGNINYTLKHYANGELCIILDPDHVPVPEFIDRVIPYFENPEIGYVQCIQGYSNHDKSFVARGAAEQTYLFYGPLMLGMQHRGTVQAIGANCTFRRAALDSIGGHADGLCEDMHTSMQLHAKKWKSVYVPELLTRGRVPESLSAFYQQQLKWSRGCFELLFEVYPKLFSKFNWKQRFHYLLTPLYFLYGIIGLIDLGVPIISLFSFQVPLFIELEAFFIRILPLLLCAMLIRHFVQRYVLDQHEEGFHVKGGILRAGTWWVYLVGFFYAIIRKRVPYIPTPKEDEASNEWKVCLPNIAVIILSITAIIYGLKYDNTPFTWMMAGFAGVNIIILGSLVIAVQRQLLTALFHTVKQDTLSILDGHWSFFRHQVVYRLIRNASFAIFIAIIALGTSSLNFSNLHINALLYNNLNNTEKRLGWVLQNKWTARNNNLLVTNHNSLKKVNIQAFEWRGWQEQMPQQCHQVLQYCKENAILPFLHWQFSDSEFDWACRDWSESLSDQQATLLNELSVLFQTFEQPIILYLDFNNSNEHYYAKKYAYQLFYQYFKENGAANITLAWEFSYDLRHDFPGKAYADLIVLSSDEHPSVATIQQVAQRVNLPVLLNFNYITFINQNELIKQLEEADVPVLGILQRNSSVPNLTKFLSPPPTFLFANAPKARFTHLQTAAPKASSLSYYAENQIFTLNLQGRPFYIKGMAYNPRHSWRDGRWYPTRRTLDLDFTNIKALGVNTLSWHESPHYDANVLRVATEKDLKIIYNFWLDPKIDYSHDVKEREILKKKIIKRIKKYQDQQVVIAWNLGSGTWSDLDNYFHQPYLTEVRQAYLEFINDLSLEIKKLDKRRPIMAGIDGSRDLAGALHHFHHYAPNLDIWGISAYNETQITEINNLMQNRYKDHPFLFSEFGSKMNGAYFQAILQEDKRLMEPSSYEKARFYARLWQNFIEPHQGKNLGGIAYCWRDRYEGTATLSGITDYKGRKKPVYYALKEVWTGEPQSFPLNDLQLKTVRSYDREEAVFRYFVMSSDLNRKDLTFEWYLCADEYLYRIDEMAIHYQSLGHLRYKIIQQLRQRFKWNFYPVQNGAELRIFQEQVNKNNYKRVYLHVSDKSGHVVTASYPLEL